MSEQAGARRVVLLARPGGARDRMRDALAQAGADIVLEADPTASDPAAVSRARPEVALIVLDTATDEALDRFDGLLSDPDVDVFFEEAELVMGREGWDAARWLRHLRAKLHRADSVLPPGRTAPPPLTPPAPAGGGAAPDAAAGPRWELPEAAADIPMPSAQDLAAIGPGADSAHRGERGLSGPGRGPTTPAPGPAAVASGRGGSDSGFAGTARIATPAQAEPAGNDTGRGDKWNLAEVADIPLERGGAIDSALEWNLAEVADIPLEQGDAIDSALEWNLAEVADIPLERGDALDAALDPGGDTGRGREWGLSDVSIVPAPDLDLDPEPAAPDLVDDVPRVVEPPSLPPLELELADEPPTGIRIEGLELEAVPGAGGDAPRIVEPPPLPPLEFESANEPPTGIRIEGLELEVVPGVGGNAPRVVEPPPLPPLELEFADEPQTGIRIEGLELEADCETVAHRFQNDMADLHGRIASLELAVDETPVVARGAVLVLAGIGGPDAVRQLLSALPGDFPRPVLVQQRLDGGHYDRLVAQMQRATALPVRLAEQRETPEPATVYILPSGVGIRISGHGLEFDDSPGSLPGTLPAGDSAVLMFSGSDPAQVDAVMKLAAAGALVAGQAPDGCYDASAPTALAARGGQAGRPQDLARHLVERWH